MSKKYLVFARWPLYIGKDEKYADHKWDKWTSGTLNLKEAREAHKRLISRGANRYFEFGLFRVRIKEDGTKNIKFVRFLSKPASL